MKNVLIVDKSCYDNVLELLIVGTEILKFKGIETYKIVIGPALRDALQKPGLIKIGGRESRAIDLLRNGQVFFNTDVDLVLVGEESTYVKY